MSAADNIDVIVESAQWDALPDAQAVARNAIAQALAATNGNVTAAAKKLGISRRTLHRKINEMNLSKASAPRRSVGENQRPTSSDT